MHLETEMLNQNDSSVKRTDLETKNESISSTSNTAARKISFKTHRNTITSGYYSNRRNVANGSKVAQITQRFNQLNKNDLSLRSEVAKKSAANLPQIIKIKETKSYRNSTLNNEKSSNEDISDYTADLRSANVCKRSKRKKCSLGKRPSLKILVSKNAICGNVLSKRQLYETNILSKTTKPVEKPKVPEKSQQVLAKTQEMKQKKLKTETVPLPATLNSQPSTFEDCKIVGNINVKTSLQPSFLYGRKLEGVDEVNDEKNKSKVKSNAASGNDDKELELADMNIYGFFCDEKLPERLTDVCDSKNIVTVCENEKMFEDGASTDDKNCEMGRVAKANASFLFRSQFSISKIDESISDIDSKEINDNQNSKEHQEELLDEWKDFESAETFECDITGEENIYQSLCEVKLETGSIKSYESFENYDEIAQNILDNKISLSDLMMTDDTYILPDKPPEVPPPRRYTSPKISSPILTSTTSQQVVQQCTVPNKDLYEKITYNEVSISKQSSGECNLSDNKHIYDSIQSRFRVDDSSWSETMLKRSERKNPSMKESGLSNCYESINLQNSSYSTINQILRHAISSQTLSSEQFRINSIYGHSLPPASEISDNSDDWVDLSDEDNPDTGEQIIV